MSVLVDITEIEKKIYKFFKIIFFGIFGLLCQHIKKKKWSRT